MPMSTYSNLPTPPTQSKLKFFTRSPQPDASAGVLNRAALESYRDERERREKRAGLRLGLAGLGGGVLLGAGGLEVFEMGEPDLLYIEAEATQGAGRSKADQLIDRRMSCALNGLGMGISDKQPK